MIHFMLYIYLTTIKQFFPLTTSGPSPSAPVSVNSSALHLHSEQEPVTHPWPPLGPLDQSTTAPLTRNQLSPGLAASSLIRPLRPHQPPPIPVLQNHQLELLNMLSQITSLPMTALQQLPTALRAKSKIPTLVCEAPMEIPAPSPVQSRPFSTSFLQPDRALSWPLLPPHGS